jgi:hypothetical protein
MTDSTIWGVCPGNDVGMSLPGTMTRRRRRSFSPEFKAEIVALCQRPGNTVAFRMQGVRTGWEGGSPLGPPGRGRRAEAGHLERSDAELSKKIGQIYAASGRTYRVPRIHDELRDLGWHVGRKQVARLIVWAGLSGRRQRRTRHTTFADPETGATNLLGRHLGAGEPRTGHRVGRRR